jgi:hypothetical protein
VIFTMAVRTKNYALANLCHDTFEAKLVQSFTNREVFFCGVCVVEVQAGGFFLPTDTTSHATLVILDDEAAFLSVNRSVGCFSTTLVFFLGN